MGCNFSSGQQAGKAKANELSKAMEESDAKLSETMGEEEPIVVKKKVRKFLADYDFEKVLGKGNFSEVRQARRKSDGFVVAVKCINPKTLEREDLEALKIEIDVLKKLDNPNIIQLHDVYFEPTMFYIVTELMGGGELFDRIIEKEFYTEEDAKKVVKTLVETIKYCHDHGVVHRDLKPENVLLSDKSDDAVIKIADFGFAKTVAYEVDNGNTLTTACGTPGYVAPEIINGKSYGREVDLWSIGVIAYILLCGYPPFHDDDQRRLFQKIKRGDFKFDSPYWDNISDKAKDLVKSLLTVNPKDRSAAVDVLKHPWLVGHDEEQHDITGAIEGLKEYQIQARKRWQKGWNFIRAVNALGGLTNDDGSAVAETIAEGNEEGETAEAGENQTVEDDNTTAVEPNDVAVNAEEGDAELIAS